ncbi:MAG TPA: amidohydrolase family protein, partial [Thermoanaerobaculia bacterium]|nr:amidohydrolase family protein [Thermoanaerobaculia bacterium]
VRRGFLTGGLPVPEGKDQLYRDSFRNVLAMVKALYDNHIPIVAGTDAMAGFSLHRELELYVQAGIPSAEVLRIATLGAASVMKHDDQLGSIAPGKLADLDIVDGDPSVNISDVRRVVTVIKDGKIFDARAVAEEIGVK